jgi:predicted flap endonuclease-1-like 5' DNA nuclease
MALLQKIKEKLGFGSGDAEGGARETEVTVESDPAAEGDAATDDGEGATPAAAGSEAAASTGSLVDEEPGDDGESEDADIGDEADEADEDEVDADEQIAGEADEDEADAEEPTEDEADAGEPTEGDAVDEGPATGDDAAATDTAAEPAEAADGEAAGVAVDDDDVGTDLEEIRGIGPAYAERLAEIGIRSVEELADADATAVAEGTSVGEKRAATWIDRANEF